MKQTPKVLAIIPARGGSKSIPRKNIKPLAGKPLLAYSIESAKQSKLITKCIVSSDDEEIISISKKLEVEVPFKRPKELAKDNSGSLEVVKHAVEFFEKENEFFDAVLILQPTSPFRENGFIDNAIESFFINKSDSLISVLPIAHQYNPHWVFKPDSNGNLNISTGEKQIIKRRQDLPIAYYRDGSIYITKTEVIKKGSLYGDKISYIESNPDNYINIDTQEDWKKAELIVNTLN